MIQSHAKQWWGCVKLFLLMIILVACMYPMFCTGLAYVFFKEKAQGSLLYREGKVIGSHCLGQSFQQAGYFQGRPSVTQYQTDIFDNTKILLPGSVGLKQFKGEQHQKWGPQVPEDLLVPSASMLDPHLSVAGILLQVPEVAKVRNIAPIWLNRYIFLYLERPWLNRFGESRINVLELNLALDKEFGHL